MATTRSNIVIATPISAAIRGFTYPGNPGFFSVGTSPNDTVRLVWCNDHNSNLIVPKLTEGFTAIWYCIPYSMRTHYQVGFFHTPDMPTWEANVGDPNDSSGWVGAGCHPYPLPDDEVNPVTSNAWEISTRWIDHVQYDTGAVATITEYQRVYCQVYIAVAHAQGVQHLFMPDYVDALNPGPVIDSLAWAIDGPGDYDDRPECSDLKRAVQQGDAGWALGREKARGIWTMPSMIAKTCTLIEVDEIIADAANSSVVADIFYHNWNPVDTDDLDSRIGAPNRPVWLLGSSASLPPVAEAA